MNRMLTFASVLESVTGVALIVGPSVAAQLLLGADASGVDVAVSRVAGISLVSLGLACWPSRDLGSRHAPAVRAMLTYNLFVTCYLAFLGIGSQFVGVLLWPNRK